MSVSLSVAESSASCWGAVAAAAGGVFERQHGERVAGGTHHVIDGLTDSGNLRLVHPQHGTEIIADGEDLNWPLMMKN